MPGLDRTGNMGLGPMTGRGLGYCSGYEYRRPCFGLGRGRGFHNGRMFYGRYFTAQAQEDEKFFLEQEAEILQNQLNNIKKRLDDFERREKSKG